MVTKVATGEKVTRESPPPQQAASTKAARLFYLDWLRVLAVVGVFLYHTLSPFGFGYWHIQNAQQDSAITAGMVAFALWGMALFFVLAGASTWFALRSRSPLQFLRERSLRLLVPLLVAWLVFSPLQAYFEALNHRQFVGTFPRFVVLWLQQPQLSWHAPWITTLDHLWFLVFLWLSSLLALPLFLLWRRAADSRMVDTLVAWCARPGGIFLFIAPLAVVRITLWAAFPAVHDWGDFALYLLCFVYGYLVISRPALIAAIRRQQWIALGLVLLCLLPALWVYGTGSAQSWQTAPAYTPRALFLQVVLSVYVWSFLVFILACGSRWFNTPTKWLPEANEAVLPFYVTHQPAIVVIAFLVVQWPIGILPKWLIITVLALGLTLAGYFLLIRPFPWVRWLFGMKAHRPDQRQGLSGDAPRSGKLPESSGRADLTSHRVETLPPHAGVTSWFARHLHAGWGIAALPSRLRGR